MSKDVLVSIKGTQVIDGEKDIVEMITSGTWYERNGKQYLLYEETYEGVQATTKNTLKIAPDLIEVSKKGPVSSKMIYELGKKHMSNYMTPMGMILLGITTGDIFVEADADTLRVEIRYAMEMNGQFVSNNTMEIQANVKGTSTLKLSE
jgi:uncharacterized beta-barrel protein YwiB (DUF1934 family)